jgi:hypothetical protein
MLVIATGLTVDVAAGTFANCLRLHENPDDPEDADIILVGAQAGLIVEENAGGRIELVRISDAP